MRDVSTIGRTAAIAAVVIAGVAVLVVLLGSGGKNYTVKADFQNASQIVKGNLVQVSGRPVGKVTGISLTPDGQAELTMKIDDAYAPLRQGTQATVRASSLSGIANRYIDLNLAPASARGIPKGGVIDASSEDANIKGVRRFAERLSSDSRVTATIVQTVSAKGYDGFAMAFVV